MFQKQCVTPGAITRMYWRTYFNTCKLLSRAAQTCIAKNAFCGKKVSLEWTTVPEEMRPTKVLEVTFLWTHSFLQESSHGYKWRRAGVFFLRPVRRDEASEADEAKQVREPINSNRQQEPNEKYWVDLGSL